MPTINTNEQDFLLGAALGSVTENDFNTALPNLSTGALVSRVLGLEDKGGGALSGLPVVNAELSRRGVDLGRFRTQIDNIIQRTRRIVNTLSEQDVALELERTSGAD